MRGSFLTFTFSLTILFLVGQFSFLPSELFSQTISPVIIGPSGGFSETSGFSISSSTGEPIINTISTGLNFFTQGFQQPLMSVKNQDILKMELTHKPTTCLKSKDGAAYVKVLNGTPPYTYLWMPEGSQKDSANGLGVGMITVFIRDADGFTGIDSIEISSEDLDACNLVFYKGITPNGDGINDQWIIDGIEYNQPNTISIYSVTGNLLWQRENYDNTLVVWKGDNKKGQILPMGTYYYVVEIGNYIEKGWVELIR